MRIRKEAKIREKAEAAASEMKKKDRKVRFNDEVSEEEDSDKDSAEYFDEEDEDGSNYSDEEDENEEEDKDGVEETLKKVNLLKPAQGVKFVQYDQYGVPLDPDAETGFDYQKHIVPDDAPSGGDALFI